MWIRIHRSTSLLLLFLLISMSPWSHAGDDTMSHLNVLTRFFSTLGTLGGKFTQQTISASGRPEPLRRGDFLLRRPGQFKWSYTSPEKQVILADGNRLTIYDEDLEQMTIKPFDAAAEGSPAGLLISSRPLTSLFTIAVMPVVGDVHWFELTPKNTSSGFRSTRIGIDKHGLREMIIIDDFDQESRIRFRETTSSPTINEHSFIVNPAPGTDISDETPVNGQ